MRLKRPPSYSVLLLPGLTTLPATTYSLYLHSHTRLVFVSDKLRCKVTRDGEVCKGTDFPGLLRPIEHDQQPPPPAHGQPTTDAPPKETPAGNTASPTAVRESDTVEDGSKDKEGEDKGEGQGEGGAVDGSSGEGVEEDEDARRAREEEERERKKKEMEEEFKKQAKSGAETLLPVVGEEVAAKVGIEAEYNLVCVWVHHYCFGRGLFIVAV